MREPSFWWAKPGIAAALLSPIAAGYGALAASRLRRTGRHTRIPVICIGNFTLGGAGKTPVALATGKMLIAAGERPFFLTRGYGGRLAGPVQVDTNLHGADDVGDEPLLLARIGPTIVSRDRVAGAEAALRAGASAIVMDDGLQNPSLAKNLTIAVVDGRRGIGNGFVFPAGPLRAPLRAQIERTDAVLVLGAGAEGDWLADIFAARRLPVFRGTLVPDSKAVADLAGHRVLAFAGIGDPEKFFRTLADCGVDAPIRRSFPDHHRYTRQEAVDLAAEASANGLTAVTTEKDWVRLMGNKEAAPLAAMTRTLPVGLKLDAENEFRGVLLRSLGTPAVQDRLS